MPSIKAQEIVYQVTTICQEMGLKDSNNVANFESIHQALLSGLLSHIGQKDDKNAFYQGARNCVSGNHDLSGNGPQR